LQTTTNHGPAVNARARIRSWLNRRTARPRLPRRWPKSVTGGGYWWSGRCPAGRSSSMTCSARSPGSPRISSPSALKRLEREGLLMAPPYSERPPRAAYQLTAEGTKLARARRLLAHGGQACRPDWFHDWLHEGIVVSGVSQVERQGLEPSNPEPAD